MIIAIEHAGRFSRVYIAGNPDLTESEHTHARITDDVMHVLNGVHEGAGWIYGQPYDNGNRTVHKRFSTSMRFDSFYDAEQFDLDFIEWLPTEGTIILLTRNEDNTDWNIRRSVKPGTITHEGTDRNGLERIFHYTVTFGELYEGEPVTVHENGDERTFEDGSQRILE